MEGIFSDSLQNTQLPYNAEAEQSVLGALLVDASTVPQALEYLKVESFYRTEHQGIFSIIMRMFLNAQTIDFITVLDNVIKEAVFKTPDEARVYLTQLVQIVPTAANIESYAKIVREKYYLRSLMDSSKKIIEQVVEGQNDASTLLDMAEQEIFDIRQGKNTSSLVRIDEVIVAAYDRLQKLSGEDKSQYLGIPTGFNALDQIIAGLNKSDLILLAARPGMGKTAFALNIASNVALKANRTVAVFSLEMSKEQLVNRMLSSQALISSNKLTTGMLSSDDWVKLALNAQLVSRAPIYLDDTPGITVSEMKAKLRRLKDVGVVFVDYLQLMNTGRRTDNRVQEISEITRGLKIMAKELNIPVIALSQLSRGPDSRSDHRPMLSDLRDSGSIEQDADIVMFLYRDSYYNKENPDQLAECIVAKNRHGETDSIKLAWEGQFTRFRSVEMFKNEPDGGNWS